MSVDALLNAVSSATHELSLSICAVFLLSSVLALWPATLGRPKIPSS